MLLPRLTLVSPEVNVGLLLLAPAPTLSGRQSRWCRLARLVEPACDPLQGGAQGQSVWADDRGVFALVSMGCNAIAKQPCGAAGLAIYQNARSGWERLFFQTVDADGAIAMKLQGIRGGPHE